jgi:hypothetical protein
MLLPRPDTFRDLTGAEMEWITEHSTCPYCGSGFIEGPRGGASVNIFCSSPSCDSRFNVFVLSGQVVTGEFTGPCPRPMFSDKVWTTANEATSRFTREA